MADRVLGASQRMGHMIEDLLDVTRIRQAGGLALQLGPAHMQALVQRTLDEVATSHPERPIDSTLQGDLAGTWDAERLCQVVTNLVGNALHHGSADHPVRIAVDGTRPEEVSITVANGGTIPPSCYRICSTLSVEENASLAATRVWGWGFLLHTRSCGPTVEPSKPGRKTMSPPFR